MAKVTNLKEVQPGELVEVVRQLRTYLAIADATSYLLYANFGEIGNDVQDAAEKARRHVESTANRLYQLLLVIEKSPIYLSIRKPNLDDAEELEAGTEEGKNEEDNELN